MCESYYKGKQIKFLNLTKPEIAKNFAFLTLASAEASDSLQSSGITYAHEKIKVGATHDVDIGNPSELRISTTIIANNLPQKDSQTSIIKAIKKFFGEDNIAGVSFGSTNRQADNKHSGWCHIQCLNVAVYTEWLNRSCIIIGRMVDLTPHKGSIDGTDPNHTTICLAHAPAREAIAEKLQAMTIANLNNPTIMGKTLTKTMRE